MAIWQVDFFIIPKKYINTIGNIKITEDNTFDDGIFWEKEHVDPSIFKPINNILPEKKPWADYLVLFGHEASNTLHVIVENNSVVSVSFRIDFTSDYEYIVRGIIEFCIANSFIILDQDLNVVPLNFEQMKEVIEKAPQVKRYNELLEGQKEKNQQK